MAHIYVHVPFCRRRCSYCDFSIAVRKQIPGVRFVDHIIKEYELRAEAGKKIPLDTLYFGGGTPSLLPPDELARLVRFFQNANGFSEAIEITIEANPDDVSKSAVMAWREAGVNRVSLGVQSLNDEILSWMHRTHSARQSIEALELLMQNGFESVSVDFIFGLPLGMRTNTVDELRELASLGPDHLSAYGLTVESNTPLGRWTERKAVMPAPESSFETEFLAIHDALTDQGFQHYEVSNYAKPNRRSVHNNAYWTGDAYLGLGPSAHSFGEGIRRWNVAPWAEYDRLMDSGQDPEESNEKLTENQRRLETVYLGLRTSDGLDQNELSADARVQEALQRFQAAGFVQVVDGRIRPMPRGWLRMDAIIVALTT